MFFNCIILYFIPRPPSRISLRPRNNTASVPPPLRSISPKTLPPAGISYAEEVSDGDPAFVFEDNLNKNNMIGSVDDKYQSSSSKRPLSAKGSRFLANNHHLSHSLPSSDYPLNSLASQNKFRSSTSNSFLSKAKQFYDKKPLSASGSTRNFSYRNSINELRSSSAKELSRNGSNRLTRPNNIDRNKPTRSTTKIQKQENQAKKSSKNATNDTGKGVTRVTRMRARSSENLVVSTSKTKKVENKIGNKNFNASNDLKAKANKLFKTSSSYTSTNLKSSPYAASNLKSPYTTAPALKSPLSTPSKKSPTGIRKISPEIHSTSSKKSKKKSPNSTQIINENDVIKRLNAAMSTVTTNIEAVTRQLIQANESLSETISLNAYEHNPYPDHLSSKYTFKNLNRSPEIINPPINLERDSDKGVDLKGNSPGSPGSGSKLNSRQYTLQNLQMTDENGIKNQFDLSKTIELKFKENNNGTYNLLATRPMSPYIQGSNRSPSFKDSDLETDSIGEDMSESYNENYNEEDDELISYVPEGISDIIEDSVREKLRTLITDNLSYYPYS